MILQQEVEKIRQEGYRGADASARLCQDIVLGAIASSSLSRNVTIKGGVVMRSLSGSARRATQDIDFDFIRYSISDESIRSFIQKLDGFQGLRIEADSDIETLNQQDYKGKRVYLKFTDETGMWLRSKLDIGVHKDLTIEQEEFCFDVCYQNDGVSLLMNSREQIIVEKLKSLLRFGAASTRYKDVFDICYLSDSADHSRLDECIHKYIYDDDTLNVSTKVEIIDRIRRTFHNRRYLEGINSSRKNWLQRPVEEVLEQDLRFLEEAIS